MATITQTTAAPPQVQLSNDSAYIPRGSVTTKLQFYKPPTDGSKPFNYVESPPEGQPQRNFGDTDLPVTIHDIRGQESNFNLDTNAVATLTTSPSAEKHFTDDASIKENYYPEVEAVLLKHVPGAKRILLFDHTIRRATGSRKPVTRVHIDQTIKSATARVHHHLPDEADELLKGRVRIVNVWRPLNGPVQATPLAFADSTTVKDEDLIGIEHRYPDRTGETAAVQHRDERWHYWSGMGNDERLLLECYDSEKGGRVPHTAFVDPRSPEGGRERESIEALFRNSNPVHTVIASLLLRLAAAGDIVWSPPKWPPDVSQPYYWGDVLNITKCYCGTTTDAANYYQFDYHNYHNDQDYTLGWTCESGATTMNGWGTQDNGLTRISFILPTCWNPHDLWRKEKRKECSASYNGDVFCYELGDTHDPFDRYFFNGQKRKVPQAGITEFRADQCAPLCRVKFDGKAVASDVEGGLEKSLPSVEKPLMVLKSSLLSYTDLDDMTAN